MSSFLKRKSRVIRGPNEHGRVKRRNFANLPWIVETFNNRRDGIQITESEGHPFKHRFRMLDGDVGGPFRTQKNETVIQPLVSQYVDNAKGGVGRTYEGTMTSPFPNSAKVGFTAYPIPLSKSVEPSSDLDSKGAIAVAASNPTNPLNNASTFLGEILKDGLPTAPGLSLWRDRTDAILGVAKEFLNAEFGWIPMVDEIREFSGSISHMAKVLRQYERDQGKLVRRSWYFPIDKSEETVQNPGGSKFPDTPRFGGTVTIDSSTEQFLPKGFADLTKRKSRKLWFSGAFTYTIPEDFFSGLYSAGSEADKLLGSTLTPQTLWELTPWSWAVDWFSNAQSVVENLEALKINGLVMPYGYMMCETRASNTYSFRQTVFQGPKGPVQSIAVPDTSFISIKKERAQANPFGFGLEYSDLTPIQLAILAALGITRAL